MHVGALHLCAEKQLSDPSQRIHKVLETARVLYDEVDYQNEARNAQEFATQFADTEWIKVADTKGCIVFATGVMRPTPTSSASYCLCVAVKRQVIIYEITRLKARHARLREVLLPAQAQSLDVFSDGRLCVGYQSGFTIDSLMGDQHPLSLVHPDNQMLGFLAYNPVDALGAIEVVGLAVPAGAERPRGVHADAARRGPGSGGCRTKVRGC